MVTAAVAICGTVVVLVLLIRSDEYSCSADVDRGPIKIKFGVAGSVRRALRKSKGNDDKGTHKEVPGIDA